MADLIQDEHRSESVQLFISVVLPVRNEHEGLRALLPDLLSQDYPDTRWEIIVADGGSTDGTDQIIKHFAESSSVPIRLVENKGIRSSAGRNLGVLTALGEVVVFIDGHCRVRSSTFLSDTMNMFQQSGAECLCRPQPLRGSREGSMGLNIAEVRQSSFGHGRGSLIYDLNSSGFVDPRSSGASYRRSVFGRIGPYDETFDACEDVEFNVRVALSGIRSYSDPKLTVEYQARNTLTALAKQMMRYGRGRIRLARKHSTERTLSSMAPFLLCLAIGLLPFTLESGLPMKILALPIVCYLIAVILATLQLIIEKRRIRLVWALAIYPIIHLGLGIGMILETLSLLLDASRWTSRRQELS